MRTVVINGGPLSVDDVVAVARSEAAVVVDRAVWASMIPARDVVDRAVTAGTVVYGVTTGFGALSTTRIDPERAEELQVSLLRSHAAGVGDPLGPEMVRAMLLLRARTLSQGHSGVRPALVERYVEFLRRDLLPVVPSQGSVGASGDLAPFAHLALPLIGEGFLSDEGKVRPAAEALGDHGLAPIHLRAKEGLSLLNGTEGMTAFAVLAIERARRLVRAADIASALSVEALLGSARPYREEIHALRPHPGQIASAQNIRSLIAGSQIGASHADDFDHAVQDAYSLRCAPQVHGAVRDTLAHAEAVVARELGSVVDNPIVLPETDEVISGGNFHGEPLAFVLDFLAIALSELGSISERRTDQLLDPDKSSGLSAFLASDPGVNSGYMVTQYVAAALVAENKVLAHPASVDSIPTSAGKEDHVSMGWGAGRKLEQIIENVTRILAVEILCAAEGVDQRAPMTPADGTAGVVRRVREVVRPLVDDRPPSGDIESVAELVSNGSLERAVDSVGIDLT